MKLLFDQNLAPRLVHELSDLFPESRHVRFFGLQKVDDTAIWMHALSTGFAIVTKDDDFRQRSFVLGAPPKVIWVRLGNCATAEVVEILRSRYLEILAFDADADSSLLLLSRRNLSFGGRKTP